MSLHEPIRVMRLITRMNIGGPAVQISGLMRKLDTTDFLQKLYTGCCESNEADYLDTVANDITAIRISSLSKELNFIKDLKALIFLIREIRRFKPHIVHTHTSKAGVLGRIASFVSRHPSIRIHTFHGHLLEGYFGVAQKSLLIIVEKVLAKFTHVLLAVGEKVRHDLIKVGIGEPHKFRVLPPGIEFGKLPPKEESKAILGLNMSRLQCGLIGRVTQIKRPDRFLDLVEEVRNRNIPIDFFIAGDGELLSVCRERIQKQGLPVVILGWQSNIERVLASADIVVLTSDSEGTPLSLIQAGMAGLPVVATAVGSIPEIVRNGVTGFVTSAEIRELANAIEKLTIDYKLRERIGLAAREFTMANFSVSRLARDHETLYKTLITNQANF